jgi:homoaconitase/3-isopropylmalate dehydratase large subunit
MYTEGRANGASGYVSPSHTTDWVNDRYPLATRHAPREKTDEEKAAEMAELMRMVERWKATPPPVVALPVEPEAVEVPSDFSARRKIEID